MLHKYRLTSNSNIIFFSVVVHPWGCYVTNFATSQRHQCLSISQLRLHCVHVISNGLHNSKPSRTHWCHWLIYFLVLNKKVKNWSVPSCEAISHRIWHFSDFPSSKLGQLSYFPSCVYIVLSGSKPGCRFSIHSSPGEMVSVKKKFTSKIMMLKWR